MANSHIFILTILFLACNNSNHVAASPKVPAILVFGDSTVDTGNNDHFLGVARADHSPYGKDFPGEVPTGRFSNGKLIPDILASKLGLKETVPPFLDPNLTENDILTGVNFASAGSGYDDLTSWFTTAIPVSKQTHMFMEYIARLKAIVGEQKANEILNNAIVIVSAATNDFLFNFYNLEARRLRFKKVSQYQDYLLSRLQNFVKGLYELGCRKMVVAGLPPVGCLPIQMTLKLKLSFNRQCLESQNKDSVLYNDKLQKLLPELEASLPGSKFAYNSDYDLLMDIVQDPQKYGFTETKRGCCGTGLMEAAALCNAFTPTCKNHSEFVFWDSIHPSQATYQLFADKLYDNVINKWLMA